MLKALKTEIKKLADPKKALILQRFFKTGEGGYGAGDVFLGLMVPQQRELVKKYWADATLADLDKLIKSKFHEERLIALLILVAKFSSPPLTPPTRGGKSAISSPFMGEARRGINSKIEYFQSPACQHLMAQPLTGRSIFKFYLSHTKYINNWDLVDLSAPNIVGEYLVNENRAILYRLAKSPSLWERRIAILATFAFIKRRQTKDTITIAEILLADKHDLIHKAVGWMLREVGKRCSEKILMDFLNANIQKMPRTTLRYAIERLPKKIKKHYLTH